jgi:hypothetical protein
MLVSMSCFFYAPALLPLTSPPHLTLQFVDYRKKKLKKKRIEKYNAKLENDPLSA